MDNENKKQVTFVSIDVETPNSKNDSICSFGMNFVDENGYINSLYTLVNPESYFSGTNTNIHGFSEKDVSDSPLFPELWESVSKYFEECVIIGHRVTFDLTCIHKAILKYKLSGSNVTYIDTYDIAKALPLSFSDYKLTTLCNYFNIPIENHHNALDDSQAALLLFFTITDKYDVELSQFVKHRDLSKKIYASKKASKNVSYSNVTTALQELKDILSQITADGIVDDSEISILNIWLKHHEELRGNYPFDDIEKSVKKALRRKAVTETDRKDLFDLFDNFVNPLKNNLNQPSKIQIEGCLICLSGNFREMTKAELSSLLEKRGAMVKNNVVQNLNYLIVGGLGNEQWALGNYGTKVKKALQFINRGFDIKIIGEDDFMKLL